MSPAMSLGAALPVSRAPRNVILWTLGEAGPRGYVPRACARARQARDLLYLPAMAHKIGTVVAFKFTAFRATTSEPYVTRSGRGTVIDNQDYSVWPCPGYAVRVTESPDYAAGEVVRVSPLSVRAVSAIGGAS